MRTFKAQKGKVLYCTNGDIVFTDGTYQTNDPVELKAIAGGVGIEEITDTPEAKKANSGNKKQPVNKPKEEKEELIPPEAPEAPKESKDKPNENLDKEVIAEIEKAETLEALDAFNVENEALKPALEKRRAELEADAIEDLQADEDIETMPKPRCMELLTKAGVEFKKSAGVADLRGLVEKLK